MSVILPIDDSIVPADVTKGYLKNYDTDFQKSIGALYEKIKKEALSKITDAPQPGASVFVLVAGSQGVGKTQMVERLMAEHTTQQFVECDVDSILKRMPEVEPALRQAEEHMVLDFEAAGHYSPETHRNILEQAIERLRPAAKYISDRLMSECVAEGYNVIVETNAKTPHISDFLSRVKSTGVILEGHICEAPDSVKIAGAKSKQHGFSFPRDVLLAESAAFRKNIPAIANACDSNLTIWWRQKKDQPLQTAAVATSQSYTAYPVAKAGFEAYFADPSGLEITTLMSSRKEVKPEAPKADSKMMLDA